jgi:hypothetical protein
MWIVVAGMFVVAAGLAAGNAVATVRLWRSPLVEVHQKVAQTVLIWLLPGMFVAVAHLIRDPLTGGGRGGTMDPTVGAIETDCGADQGILSHGSDDGGDAP